MDYDLALYQRFPKNGSSSCHTNLMLDEIIKRINPCVNANLMFQETQQKVIQEDAI